MSDTNEKHERFRRIAEKRTNQILDGISKLEKCADRYTYDYTEEEAERIIAAIEEQLESLRQRFTGKKKFSLTDEVKHTKAKHSLHSD